jgi:hypothetical protein
MLPVASPLFLLVPDSSKKRVLHPGRITAFVEGVYIAQMDEPLLLAEGAEVIAFHTMGAKFMQQGACVVAQSAEEEPPAAICSVAFKLVGEAISAEQRQIYRVSMPLANIKARIGKEVNCHIVDISSEGCAAMTRQEHKIGSTVPINFVYEGQSVVADARVQTAKAMGDGRYRYGFFIADKKSPARKALTAICMLVQRQQLKRLSGAA